jgi:hypothetical protein
VSKPSLVSKNEGAAPPADPTPPADEVKRDRAPYVTFATPKSGNWGKFQLSIPSIKDGDPVLVRDEPYPPLALVPFIFYLLKIERYNATTDDAGQLVATGDGLKDEYYESVILIHTPAGFVPATSRVKNTKKDFAAIAKRALDMAATAEWPTLSPAHAASIAAEQPFMRFKVQVSLRAGTSGRGRKNVYTSATIIPTTVEDHAALRAFLNDDAKKKLIADAEHAHARRMQEVAEKARK